jgi:hypothetical protein
MLWAEDLARRIAEQRKRFDAMGYRWVVAWIDQVLLSSMSHDKIITELLIGIERHVPNFTDQARVNEKYFVIEHHVEILENFPESLPPGITPEEFDSICQVIIQTKAEHHTKNRPG